MTQLYLCEEPYWSKYDVSEIGSENILINVISDGTDKIFIFYPYQGFDESTIEARTQVFIFVVYFNQLMDLSPNLSLVHYISTLVMHTALQSYTKRTISNMCPCSELAVCSRTQIQLDKRVSSLDSPNYLGLHLGSQTQSIYQLWLPMCTTVNICIPTAAVSRCVSYAPS